ncbi:Bug family tripartite tricarboxylate transporter substrate binding protein [Achromobacter mucicolens]|uniref:Bug family tripartite tricarboxylate transporter substrate binding protein n=1 Tax=Achromobacter mucicolens TaxID=1389922 RepID=UPI001CBC4213|nr:tripartite tricarboxylate transporter substrate binding protein [Achromobacter mucicolens]UAN00605.1 tripartite tricarboxylate transporter substrate binding protein [Achromobacter mucicolens]
MKLSITIAAASALAFSSAAIADAYPTKPIRLIIPFAVGGSTDNLGRVLAARLSEKLGQQVVADNRPGAGGNIGTDLVAKAPADGYTLLFATEGTLGINPSLYKKLPFDPEKDFTPIAQFASVPNILVVNPKVQAKTVQELAAYAKSKPASLNMGSAGNGTTNHLSGELFQSMTGTSFTHVPYKGSGPAMADLLADQIQLMFDNLPGSLPHVKAGSLRALAVTSAKRSPLLPDVPTMAEAGVPGYDVEVWFGVAAPKGLPAQTLATLSKAITEISQEPATIEKILNIGATPLTSTPAEFGSRIQEARLKWAPIVAHSGAKID